MRTGSARCVAAVAGPAAVQPLLDRRLALATGWLAPLGPGEPAIRHGGGAALVALELVSADGRAPGAAACTAVEGFLADPGPGGAPAGHGALFALDEEGASVTTAAAPVQAAYLAEGPDGSVACATHAVVASLLASGRAAADLSLLPELLAAEFLGEERCLIAGVRAVRPATRVRLRPGRVSAQPWMADAERWRAVPVAEAAEVAEAALLGHLEAIGEGPVWLGATAGADSRAVALAAVEAGLELRTWTWGAPGEADVEGGRRVAAALGVPHEVLPYVLVDDAEALAAMDREVRWNEGHGPLTPFGRVPWPAGLGPVLTGHGGETGRAFFYADRAHLAGARPQDRRLRTLLSVEDRLPGARPEALEAVRAAAAGWLARARESGREGLDLLDVVYADERLRGWGRSELARLRAPIVLGLHAADLTRALASLPLEDKLSDGFHRRFVAARRPDLAPPAPGRSHRRGLPRAVRLAADRARRERARRRGLRSTPFPVPWDRVPVTRRWLLDEVCLHPPAVEALGAPFCHALRTGIAASDLWAIRLVAQLTSAVVLERALHGFAAAPAEGTGGGRGTPAP